ncbi:P-loop containing nucleoside triphosphate hydrolase protein [Didymella exigua CBS 183.55]|uniref:P-loop containing nucleoside triphosphate hydrolase protein n=1 Tax=Didymella exigua CBS 183.55 TaxID=1150837 RepID=A0A6A5RDU0_9PLEO|nr:P-loop containing nucleoside triphosphate hydrolase protein [Didymella exigua CBS 183.55]KAF1925842.1 P-loop containing nucleoside triphosphate hydrolase protein [Didymella exigua CBS 183.55]
MYANLDGGPGNVGECNAHLAKRFGNAVPQQGRNPQVPDDSIPESVPTKANDDVRKYYELACKPVAGAGPWLEMPEIPHPREMLRQEPASGTIEALITTVEEPRPKKINGAYDSTEDYLRTEYELLREDALRPLCEAVAQVRKAAWKDEAQYEKSVGIYEPVYITSLVFSTRGLATRVAFSMSRVKKLIRWEQSKRLIAGTLVALSPCHDAFQTTCILAVVAARPLSALQPNPPEVDLFFPHYHQPIDPMQSWIMVECRSSFFEASRHTLLALQHMMREPFPLAEHLVDMKRDVEAPAYIQNNPYVDLSSLVSMEEASSFQNVNVLEEWPANDATSLDNSQSRALKRMLAKKLALVQGPPGTGKTFVSVKAVQVLGDNMRKDDAPIIITAQTNHAVDQILRHTSAFEPNYVRLGGRSKDAEIRKRTLFEVRSAQPPAKRPHRQKTEAQAAMRKAQAAIQRLLAPLEMGKGPLDHRVLRRLGLLTQDQADSLEMDTDSFLDTSNESPGDLMHQWLGKALTECRRPAGPDDFGWEWEEEDLEVEQLQELEAEATAHDDDDIEALKGEVLLMSDNYRGKGSRSLNEEEIKDILEDTADLTTIEFASRGPIYNYLLRQVKKLLLRDVRDVARNYHDAVQQRRVGLWEEDVNLLSKQRIIGVTTTGLSKYRALIAALRPRVVLVEEAAETMEAPVAAACLPTVEHLILVGDHQQLRPHTQVKKLEGAPFHLNLSMFERLVMNEVEYDQLTRQRRMIPEIRRLLRPIYNDTLKDHASVEDPDNRPPILGMGGVNSYYFTHTWDEGRDAYSSCFNEPEAKFLVGFVDYLVLNGEAPAGITILTFYNGQRKRILQLLRAHPNLRSIMFKVVTVDSYQGEENDIVLLSLVRSNKHHSIGFLSNENRACVALSRAKRGFYLFGNAELLACESWTWGQIANIMFKTKVSKARSEDGQERRIGYCLPLQCTQHRRKVWIEYTDDWEQIHGGCDERCKGVLSCGHPCPYKCHPFEHDQVNCVMQCSATLNCRHRCMEVCSDTCKCRKCDQRPDGRRSMLKPAPNAAMWSRAPPSQSRGVSLDSGFQTRPNPPPQSGSRGRWRAYVNGGAEADDARMLQKRREGDMAWEGDRRNSTPRPPVTAATDAAASPSKLIETSPRKPAPSVSGSASLLVDLDINSTYEAHPPQPARTSYASAAGSGKTSHGGSQWSLLD